MEIELQTTITLVALLGVAFATGGMWRDVHRLKEDVKAIKHKVFYGIDLDKCKEKVV